MTDRLRGRLSVIGRGGDYGARGARRRQRPGRTVREAELVVTSTGNVFKKIEVVV